MEKQLILIVEDNSHVAATMSDMVEYMGHEAKIATCGEDAMTALETETPDLVILDWMLPDIEGINILRHIRQSPLASTPVIMLTAKTEIESLLLGLEAGADDYITKPFGLGELQARIDAILRRAG
jgi:DNA-binding response OmpR family regulator